MEMSCVSRCSNKTKNHIIDNMSWCDIRLIQRDIVAAGEHDALRLLRSLRQSQSAVFSRNDPCLWNRCELSVCAHMSLCGHREGRCSLCHDHEFVYLYKLFLMKTWIRPKGLKKYELGFMHVNYFKTVVFESFFSGYNAFKYLYSPWWTSVVLQHKTAFVSLHWTSVDPNVNVKNK